MLASGTASLLRRLAALLAAAVLAAPAPALAQPAAPAGVVPVRPPPKQEPAPQPRPPQRQPLMPMVTGMPLILAQVILLQRGLVAQVQTAPSDTASGVVTAQAPGAGQPVEAGRPVRLWVSSGPRPPAPQPPKPAPTPAPVPPPPRPVQPQPVRPTTIVQPIRPPPVRPTPIPSPPRPHPQPPRPAPIGSVPTPAPPSSQPIIAQPPSPPLSSAPTPPSGAAPQPVAVSARVPTAAASPNAGWLWLAAAALAATVAAFAALVLRGRRRLPATAGVPAGAPVPFSVAATLAGGVQAAARDVHPTTAPTISIGWTIDILPPRIEGLSGVQSEPGQ